MPATLTYDIIAIDLDGTLLTRDGAVSARNVEAVRRAHDAGAEIVLCTGRGVAESQHVFDTLDLEGTAIVVGGAMTVEVPSGRTIRRSVMPVDLVTRLAEMLNAATGHYVLLLKDRSLTEIDYLLVGDGCVDPASEWWFTQVPVAVDRVDCTSDDPFPELTMRVGIVTTAREMHELSREVIRVFGEKVFLHHFPVISACGNGRHLADEAIHLMEVFNAETNKWTALEALAQDRQVPVDRVAAIGDEINDLTMIRHAGLGIAMGNGLDTLKAAADRETKANTEDGVAHALEMILSGAW